MKKTFYSILFVAVTGILGACSNGDYLANPSNPGNGSINPLNPLKSEDFTWTGTDPMSADINGTHWVAEAASFTLDTSGTNILVGTKGANIMGFYLNNVWSGNLYDMGFKVGNRFGTFLDSATAVNGAYFSYLGNSGEVKILENDSAYIKGQFYFQGVTTGGKIINVTNGYFKIAKP